MKKAVLLVTLLFATLALGPAFGTGASPARPAEPGRVVSLGGSITEIIYDLKQEDRLVATDLSSLYPEAATQLPRVGYYRALPLEGILSMRPTLIIASENAGPRNVLDRIEHMGIAVERVSDTPSLASLYTRIDEIARVLAVPAAGAALASRVRAQVAQAQDVPGKPRRTLFLMNRTGQSMAAGAQTAAHATLTLAGLRNVLSDQSGYRPLSAEGVAALAPEMIVITRTSPDANDLRGFLEQPGIAATPAARNQRVLVMDDLLILGLGPRTGEAIRLLRQASQ